MYPGQDASARGGGLRILAAQAVPPVAAARTERPEGGTLAAGLPRQAKDLGRRVRGFDEEKWVATRFELVVRGNLAKFDQHANLREFLLGTGERVLVEASPVDRIWGIGLAADDERAEKPGLWRGLNLLGFALMEVRRALRR